jgi:glycerol dehydrogenase
VSELRIAPATLVRGEEALARAVPQLASLGRRLLWVHGPTGAAALDVDVAGRVADAGATVQPVLHEGSCSDRAVSALRAAAGRCGADAIVAVGGGRVLDAAKAAADDLRRPYAAVPTSPATCAAVTPLAVMYDDAHRYVRTRPTRRAPDLAVLDRATLAAAPDRLLVAGAIDALAKIHEVRRTLGDAHLRSAGAAAALALCDDLERTIDACVEPAVAPGAPPSDVRARLAEACLLHPGLIGGLAGEEAKLAAAHPLHNALTRVEGAHAALHGELVGFGVLVQILLTGAGEAAVREGAGRFARWGVACHLEALGCPAARGEAGRAAARETVATAAMRAAFPDVDADALIDAMQRVDAWSRDEAARVASTHADARRGAEDPA